MLQELGEAPMISLKRASKTAYTTNKADRSHEVYLAISKPSVLDLP